MGIDIGEQKWVIAGSVVVLGGIIALCSGKRAKHDLMEFLAIIRGLFPKRED